jgi:hypothetical protein
MKKFFYLILVLFISCSKENIETKEPSIPVTFNSFGYCNLEQGIKFSFLVEENSTVKSYTLLGNTTQQNLLKISEISSKKTKGDQLYEIQSDKKTLPYYFKIRVLYNDKKTEDTQILYIK